MTDGFDLRRHNKRNVFTPKKKQMAHEMCRDGATNDAIASEINMGVSAVQKELASLRKRMAAEPWGKRSRYTPRQYATGHDKVPQSVLAERASRIAAVKEREEDARSRGDVTFLIGDLPPPGYSALDKRRARA